MNAASHSEYGIPSPCSRSVTDSARGASALRAGGVSSLAAAGHLEAYDYWLFAPGWPEEFEAWVATHEQEFDAMVAYVDAHVFTPARGVGPDDRVPAR